MLPFTPHTLLRSGQLQTYAGTLLTGNTQAAPYSITHVDLCDGDRLQLFVHDTQQARRPNPPIVLLLHGLGGSADSAYMLRITRKLNLSGVTAVRFNHRGCGPGGAPLARAIYHAARFEDIGAAVCELSRQYPHQDLLAVGFSLSANMLLRYLAADHKSLEKPKNLVAALAICPPVDLDACSRAISRVSNWLIDHHYTQIMRKTAVARSQLFPDLHHPQLPKRFNLREFDQIYTAPLAGYLSRDDYYAAASAKSHLERIHIPTTIIASDDDPIIPVSVFSQLNLSRSTQIMISRGGGHMGFIANRRTPLGDYRWMDALVVDWASR